VTAACLAFVCAQVAVQTPAEPLDVEYVDVTTPPPAPQPKAKPAAPPLENRVRAHAGIFVASPGGDMDDEGAGMSLGFRIALGYRLTPAVTAHILYRREFVERDGGQDDPFYTSDVGIGARYTIPFSGAYMFFEGTGCISSLTGAAQGFNRVSLSGVGIELRVGAAFQLSQATAIELSGSYLSANVDTSLSDGPGESEVRWLSAHVDVAVRL
jgi:hypothetical protein